MFDAGKRLNQSGSHDFEFAAVMSCQLVEQTRPFCGDAEQDAAGIVSVAGSLEQALFLRAVCELDYAVVPQAEALGRIGDGGDCVGRRSGNLQQQLMLLRLETRVVSGLFTELYEGAKAIAKFGQAFDEAVGGVCYGVCYVFHFIYIVSRHISFQMLLRVTPAVFC
jgi:hypothetical protein